MPTKNKLKKKKLTYVPRSTRLEALGKSLRINYLFYISILISALILKYDKQNTKSLKCIILSFILIAALGYLVHYIGHHINVNNQFFKSNSIITETFGLKGLFKLIANIMDFHSLTHHDTKINKQNINVFYEFITNFITQGLQIFLMIRFYKYLDERVCFIWGLAYATVHNINYNIIKPEVHKQHHINDKTNYGIDIYDILFGTKFNWEDIEDFNHFGINFIIITIAIVIIHRIFKKWIK